MKKGLLVSFAVFISMPIFSQLHWESIILAESQWNYLPAISEPASQWKEVGFDDSSWEQGPGGIGYGDDDDTTIIDTVASLYLRQKFLITDISQIESLLLDIDYDDAFVAYLNGVEIARSVNVTEQTPAYNSPLTFHREALMYAGGLPERYSIDKSILEEGSNLLAVHIINFGMTSSDMTSIVFLNAQVNSNETVYNDIPAWFQEPGELPGEVNLTESKLPIVVINTNGIEIPDDPKINAHMGIIYNGSGAVNKITDPFNNYDGSIAIEVRGESAQMFPKKSFLLETRNALGQNNNVSLLDMPRENDWILYAPYSDKSMLRNTVTFKLGDKTGHYGSRTAYCELVLNGQYHGVYVLMERIKRDSGRVDIATLNPDEITGDDLTGGYIIRVDKRDEDYVDGISGWTSYPSPNYPNAMNITYQYFYPGDKDIVDEQRNYIRNHFTEAEKTLISRSFDDPDEGYNKYLNVSSFVDFMLINEIPKEVDNYRYSTYFHKKKESKGGEILAGPLWDFNLGYANVDYWPFGLETEGWLYEDVNPWDWSIMFWWKRLMEDAFFEDLVATRWKYLRENDLSDDNIQFIIDSVTSYISDAQQRNYIKWPILGEYIWPNFDWFGNTYADEVSFFENWMFDRVAWIDNNINGDELNPTASIARVDFDAVLNSIQVTIKLSDDYFTHTKPGLEYFKLNNNNPALYIKSVRHSNASEAEVYLSEIPNSSAESVSITIDPEMLNGFQTLTTNTVTLTTNADFDFTGASVNIFSERGKIITIDCDRPNSLPGSFEVYNTVGQLVGVYSLEQQSRNRVYVELNENIYIVRMMVDGKPVTKRVVLLN
jgi:hypothetical protein